jgi:antitoxin component YwqK of YwqJK toxin-antitoxin module
MDGFPKTQKLIKQELTKLNKTKLQILQRLPIVPSGNKIFEQEFLNDVENGIVRVYGPEGKIKTVGKFKNGLREGNWQDMDAMGRTLKKYTYVNGKLPDEDN